MNKLNWIDGTGSLSDDMGLACIGKLYLLRMGGGGGVGWAVNKEDGEALKGVCEGVRVGVCEGVGMGGI